MMRTSRERANLGCPQGLETALLHHTMRLGVIEEVVGVHRSSSQVALRMLDERGERLRGVSLTPMRRADPVACGVLIGSL